MSIILKRLLAVVAALALLATACGGSDTDSASDNSDSEATSTTDDGDADATDTAVGADACDTVDDVTLQLQWFAQAQFAGYYAAADEGLYAARCLNVTITEGGVDIVPQQQLASGAADFAISWVPKALVSREEGLDIVDVGQIFQRSGTLQVSFADSGISSPADFAGKKIGSWGFGNEFEVLAGARAAGVEPGIDFEIVQQNFDMLALINGDIDAAQAMTYNEYAQVLETVNPDTGELFTADDLTVINWNDVGSAMLQDAIWADGSRLDDPAYQNVTTRFIAASIEGWAWCRDNADACVEVVLNNGPTLGESHQAWQLNEVSALIWPSPDGAGLITDDAWAQTVDVSTSEGVLAAAPDAGAYTNEWAEAALKLLADSGVDAVGNGFSKIDVTLNEGGS